MKRFALIFLTTAVLCSGQATISGTISTQGGWSMPITNTLASLTITPPTTTLNDGSSAQFSATGTFALGNTAPFTATATWTSSNLAIATNVGTANPQTFSCVGAGTIAVTATVGTIQTQAALNCLAPPSGSADNTYCGPGGVPIGPSTDGPATLPQQCYYTPLSATPSPGATLGPVVASALASTYATAPCGVTILVTKGTSFTGVTTLTGKGCDDLHYITIKSTGVSDPSFPAEGTRGTPCQSNVASLPNRASYPCTAPLLLTAQFVATSNNSGLVLNGADHIRFIGIEVTRVSTPGASITSLIDLTASGATQTNHIIFDRVWVHGINADGSFPQTAALDTSTTRGFYLAQSNHVAVIDSYISDFYDNGGGTISGTAYGSSNGNTDAQCLAGGFGSIAQSGWGVYKFVNNHCEGSGEGILFGGSAGPIITPVGCTTTCNTDTPFDIEVRRNYFVKPLSWNGNTTTVNTVGWPVVKNGFEMKTGARALFEGNFIENCWFSAQGCGSFNVAPVNQQSGGQTPTPTCPTCVVQDFVYRYNYSYNTAYGIAVYSFTPTTCSTCQSQGMNRVNIHDNVIGDNMNMGNLTGVSSGDAIEILADNDPSNRGLNKTQNLVISHNTFVKDIRGMILFGGPTDNTRIVNLTMQNNLWSYGNFGFISVGNTGGCDTVAGGSFFTALGNCTTGFVVDHNAEFNVVGTLGHNWPSNGSGLGNWFFTSPTATGNYLNSAGATVSGSLGFTSYNSGDSLINPANYALSTTSPLHNAATDGTDIGADIATVVSKTTNVRDSPNQGFTPGNLVIYPSSATVEQGTTVPFACDNAGNTTCVWTLTSGVGTVDSKGNYKAPNATGSAVLQAVNGSNLVTANITVAGTTPTTTGDCATVPYPHNGLTLNVCHMVHTELVGGAVTRNWHVVVPTNYVSGQSGMILVIGDSHFLSGAGNDPCLAPGSEIEGWSNYLATVPAPAPVLVCSEGYSSSSGTFDPYNSLGRVSYTWLNNVIPNDVDFLRQLILITVRDMNLNPKAVYVESYFNANGNVTMAVQLATTSSDLIAAISSGEESNFHGMNSSFTVNRVGAADFGLTLPTPAVPVSLITLTNVFVSQVGVFSQICGNNLANTANLYQPLTVDDTFRFWNQTDHTTSSIFQPSNVGSSFCTGTYDGSGNGLMSTLQVRKDTGGKLGTAIYAYKLTGNGSKPTPFCGFDYSGNDTLGCNNAGGLGATAAIDFRNATCSNSVPCNAFLDAGTGSASASGYSTVDMEWKFLKNHPKP